MTVYPNNHAAKLSDIHKRMLFAESGISPDVAEERGYRTARGRSDVPECFADYQRKPGLVVPMRSPDGITHNYQLRPDKPRKNGPKYESPHGSDVIIDVHPRALEEVRSGDGDLWVVEGVKKADALVSRGIAAVALAGVWMAHVKGSKGRELLPCWDHVNKQRRINVGFDSDWRRKAEVHDALQRVAEGLERAGAEVRVAYLEDAPDGSKVGVDDYLVAGGTVSELKMLCGKFERRDIGEIRLSRDEKLRAAFEDLERRHSDTAWTWRGADADEDLFLAVAGAARKHGKIHADGIRVRVSWGTLALEAKIGSSRTVGKGLARLQARGLLHKDNAGREEGKTGAFVLVASVKQVGESPAEEEKATRSLRGSYRTTLHPQSPRLRASRPKLKPTKKMIQEHRLGTRSRLPEPREGLKRLGKKRSHVFDRLDAGGTLSVEELGGMLGVRPYDLTRRKTSPKGRDGLLAWPEEAGIILIEGNTVALADDWLDRLEEAREKGEELEADERAEKDRKRRSRAYREYLAERRRGTPAVSNPSAAGLEAVRRSRQKAREHRRENLVGWTEEAHDPAPLSPLAVAVRTYLERCPADARQPPGWLGSTLWAYELCPGKPTPVETRAAVEELGGAAYLEEKLKQSMRRRAS